MAPTGRRVYTKMGKFTFRKKRAGGLKAYRSVRQRTGAGMKVIKSNLNEVTHTPLLPVSKLGKLPYSDWNLFSCPATNTAGGYVFTANGLFDPNITGVGHQPMGFDQMMLFYEHYTVTRSRITVNFWNTSTTESVVVGISIAPDATLSTVITTLNENGMLVKKALSPNNGGDSYKCTLSITADISKINGKRDVKSENDFRGDIASNPAEQTYFHIWAYDEIVSAAKNVNFEVLIEYDAIFTEPRKMIAS